MITSIRSSAHGHAAPQRRPGDADPIPAQAVAIGPMRLRGRLSLGPRPAGLVLLVRCSGGGSGHLHANRFVAETFQRHWFGTLSLDLLTDDESADEHCRADCALLARRIGDVLQWTAAQPRLAGYRCALFGAGTGGAALLQAAAAAPGRVDAVIARGARLDLAWPSLPAVRAPTLLIAGTEAAHELEQHRAALRQLQCAKRLEVVPGATLVFQDAGVLDTVAELSAWWLTAHLGGGASR